MTTNGNPTRRAVRPRLMKLRDVAQLVGLKGATLRLRVADGEWPEPHAILGRVWLYRVDLIEHWLNTGRWPDDAKFRMGEGRGRVMP